MRLPAVQPGLGEIAREWGRIGCVGFGGPPAMALSEPWQAAILAAAALPSSFARGSVVTVLLAAGAIGALAALLGAALPSG